MKKTPKSDDLENFDEFFCKIKNVVEEIVKYNDISPEELKGDTIGHIFISV